MLKYIIWRGYVLATKAHIYGSLFTPMMRKILARNSSTASNRQVLTCHAKYPERGRENKARTRWIPMG